MSSLEPSVERSIICLLHYIRKASASVLAVDEHQTLETLVRDERTTSRALAQLKGKHEELDQKKSKLVEEARVHSERKSEARPDMTLIQNNVGLHLCHS